MQTFGDMPLLISGLLPADDGNFVPNITFGSPVIACLRKNIPKVCLDCHMMVAKPSQWVDDIGKAGGCATRRIRYN